jgi:hypothetical protein
MSDAETGYASAAASDDDDNEEIFSDVPEWLEDLAERAGVPAGAPRELLDMYPEMKVEICSHLASLAEVRSLGEVNHEFRALLFGGMRRDLLHVATIFTTDLAALSWDTAMPRAHWAVFMHNSNVLTGLTHGLGWLRCLRMNYAQRPRIEPTKVLAPSFWDQCEDDVLRVLQPEASVYTRSFKKLDRGAWLWSETEEADRWTYTPRNAVIASIPYYTFANIACAVILSNDYPRGTERPVDVLKIVTAIDAWVMVDGFAFCYMTLQQQLYDTRHSSYLREGTLTPIPSVYRSTTMALIHLIARHALGLPSPFDSRVPWSTENFEESRLNHLTSMFAQGLPQMPENATVTTCTPRSNALQWFDRTGRRGGFTEEFWTALRQSLAGV